MNDKTFISILKASLAKILNGGLFKGGLYSVYSLIDIEETKTSLFHGIDFAVTIKTSDIVVEKISRISKKEGQAAVFHVMIDFKRVKPILKEVKVNEGDVEAKIFYKRNPDLLRKENFRAEFEDPHLVRLMSIHRETIAKGVFVWDTVSGGLPGYGVPYNQGKWIDVGSFSLDEILSAISDSRNMPYQQMGKNLAYFLVVERR